MMGRSAPMLARLEEKTVRGVPESLKWSPDFVDAPYIHGIVGKLPARFIEPLERDYRKAYQKQGQQAANVRLGETGRKVAALQAKTAAAGLSLAVSDDEICAAAVELAREVRDWLMRADRIAGPVRTAEEAGGWLREFAANHGAVLPPKVELRGMVARLTDPGYWRRVLRRSMARDVESAAIGLGLVHRFAGLYCSDETLNRHQAQKRRNLQALQETEAVNSEGEAFTLAELAELGVSNPSVRFAELMVRVKGMEAHARAKGHVGLFITATTPSRMHARISETGDENDLFDGTAPREGQQWLARQWARMRAALARLGVKYYGVRVAEPHHDGTPHWHMLLFVAPWISAGRSALSRLIAVIRRYLRRGDWAPMLAKQVVDNLRANGLTIKAATQAAGWVRTDEIIRQRRAEKADKARNKYGWQFVEIDWSQGSAAGYLVKYLSKNISGERMGEDAECGKPAKETAGRVLAWASTWGIRQFQVVGGPPVGVWRELRRLKEKPEQLELFAAWEATGSKAEERAPDWGKYIEAQGGIDIKRADRPVQLWKLEEPGRRTKYLDEAPARVAGVVCAGRATATRETVWTIRRAGNEGGGNRIYGRVLGVPGERAGLSRGNRRKCTGPAPQVAGDYEAGVLGFQAGAAGPWTRVNNCTPPWWNEEAAGVGSVKDADGNLIGAFREEARRARNRAALAVLEWRRKRGAFGRFPAPPGEREVHVNRS